MSRLMGFILAAAVTAIGGLLARRLLLQARTPASLPIATRDPAAAVPKQLAEPDGEVSPRAVRSAARSLPGTREELYSQAAELGVRGRSRMNKQQLYEAVEAQSSRGDS
jgi:hypothetical protein